jgi:20S proteasome alpha/beta subunit
MTLVAAFRHKMGGIVLCADREENDGFARREVDKIHHIKMDPCDVFIAGAGSSSLVSKANNLLEEKFREEHSAGKDVVAKHLPFIESTLKFIHKEYAANLKDGFLELLIVFAPRSSGVAPLLYRTDRSMLVHEPEYAAQGAGKSICDYFADRMYVCERLDYTTLTALAAFIFREVESFVHGVGVGTDMYIIRDRDLGWCHFSQEAMKKIEAGIPSLSDAIFGYWKDNATIPKWAERP